MSQTVVIADDQTLFAETLEAILSYEEEIDVVALAHNGLEAIAATRQHRPDLVLMDIAMPVMDGIEATREIVQLMPEIRVIMLTGSLDAGDLERARAAGATGYVTKDQVGNLAEVILEVVRAVESPA